MHAAFLLLLNHRKPPGGPTRMASTATVTGINYLPSGAVHVSWDDGTTNEFNDRDAVAAFAQPADDASLVKRLILRAWLHRSEDASNPAWVQNRIGQLDLSLELNQLSFGVA